MSRKQRRTLDGLKVESDGYPSLADSRHVPLNGVVLATREVNHFRVSSTRPPQKVEMRSLEEIQKARQERAQTGR